MTDDEMIYYEAEEDDDELTQEEFNSLVALAARQLEQEAQEAAWNEPDDRVVHQLAHLQDQLGRDLTNRELEGLMQDFIDSGQDPNYDPAARHEAMFTPLDINTDEGRTDLFAEYLEDSKAEAETAEAAGPPESQI
jgi:hypothetical protein